MNPIDKQNGPGCSAVRPLLSEYIDNTLSARRAWEVEKHLAACVPCSGEVRELQATIAVLRAAPRLDTSDRFMAALHARLDAVDPSLSTGRPLWQRVRTWFSDAGTSLYSVRVPALSLGLAAAAIAIVVTSHRPMDTVAQSPQSAAASDSVHVSIASSANSPFSDPAADNLEFRSGARSAGAPEPF